MKRMSVWAVVIVAAGMMITSCNRSATGGNVSLKTAADSACYAFGVTYGSNFASGLKTFPGGPANIDALIAGFVTAIREDTFSLKMTAEVGQAYIQQYLMAVQEKEGETSKAEGEAFLAANKTKEGVITTESGLQYKVLTEGSGQKPTAEDQVKVHYTGRLLDGTVFDSSVERGEPVTFALGGVIPGWTEALQIMPVGSKYQLWIPSDLAYGVRGNQGIRPNSTLEFEVELLEIVKPEKK